MAWSDILEESWVYQEILQKGIEREKEQALLRFVELRFPSLLVLARQVIESGMSLQQLQALQDRLYLANTIKDASTALQGV